MTDTRRADVRHADVRRIVKAHQRSYEDPIVMQAGDALITGKTDNWNGHIWVWCEHVATGKSGWVPDSSITPESTAAHDYSAMELTVEAGDVVTVTQETHGWAWCVSTSGAGWVPLENLENKENRS